uniref:Uncharacterized protein n=1 Tax=Arundo donax TaxID=35708 RepID=A0A0A8ZTA7_ARUDO
MLGLKQDRYHKLLDQQKESNYQHREILL